MVAPPSDFIVPYPAGGCVRMRDLARSQRRACLIGQSLKPLVNGLERWGLSVKLVIRRKFRRDKGPELHLESAMVVQGISQELAAGFHHVLGLDFPCAIEAQLGLDRVSKMASLQEARRGVWFCCFEYPLKGDLEARLRPLAERRGLKRFLCCGGSNKEYVVANISDELLGRRLTNDGSEHVSQARRGIDSSHFGCTPGILVKPLSVKPVTQTHPLNSSVETIAVHTEKHIATYRLGAREAPKFRNGKIRVHKFLTTCCLSKQDLECAIGAWSATMPPPRTM